MAPSDAGRRRTYGPSGSGYRTSDLGQQDLSPLRGGAPGWVDWRMTGELFIGDHVLLDVCFATARSRLGRLAGCGVLLRASEHAYGETITSLAGPGWAASQLAGVSPGDITEECGMAHLPVHWEATTGHGALFPALDADLTLTPAGDHTTVFALAGVFRPPPGMADSGLDHQIVCWFAAAAIRVFLARLAAALVHPSGSPGLPARPDRRWGVLPGRACAMESGRAPARSSASH
jgi:hypothetical protein